jgi:ParB family chromosome partitioning protein
VTAKRKAGLGRGLQALIPTEPDRGDHATYLEVPVDGIKPNPDQPRSRFDDQALEELAASIEEVGVLQPVVLSRADDGTLYLIAGERRWRAARKAGLDTIPAVVRGATGETTLVEALIENVQRQDLTPLEEAHAYKQLLENTGMNQEQVAERVGKSRPSVSNTLRLLQLPGAVQRMIDSGQLSAGHARALVGLEDERYSLYLAEKAAGEGWSVRQIEDAVRDRREMGQPKASTSVREVRPVEIIELEKRLADRLGSRVKINYRNQKGKVEIRFTSLEDLERIYRSLA